MKKLIFASILLTLFIGAGALAAQEKNTIVFAVDATYPPLEFMEGDTIVGYGPDYFTAVCQEMGLKAEFREVVWDHIFDGLNAGEYDAIASSVTITPERRADFDFTIPYYVVRQSLFVPQDSGVNDVRQLNGLKVGSQVDTTATGIIDKLPGAISTPYPTIAEAFKAMSDGELDAIICEDVVGGSFLKDPAYSGKFKVAAVIDTPGAEELYGAAVRKGNLDVLIPLNDGIKALRAKGTDADLRRKWIGDF